MTKLKEVSLSSPENPASEKIYSPKNRIRFVTAASLFDGHDASINIMRRILQSSGAEVIHLGHNQSAADIVNAAIQENANGIAISSYQGGHVEFFKYVIDLLKSKGAAHIKVFGGGGGTIAPHETRELENYGVIKIYSPEDGRHLGLQGIINHMLSSTDRHPLEHIDWLKLQNFVLSEKSIAEALSCLEYSEADFKASPLQAHYSEFLELKQKITVPKGSPFVVGITGTGGAGKSSLTDELINRLLEHDVVCRVGILAIDPIRKKTGGALLGDRLRMNSLKNPRCFMRSFGTRESSVSHSSKEAIALFKASGFDWIFVETAGIGQSDTAITSLVEANIYVMTSEFGAPTQLEKINMLDFADIVVLNKFDKSGAEDAFNDVKKQLRRNHRHLEKEPLDRYPIFGTIASRFGDSGVNAVFDHLLLVREQKERNPVPTHKPYSPDPSYRRSIVPPERATYLAEIAREVRSYKKRVMEEVEKAARLDALLEVKKLALSEATSRELDSHLKEASSAISSEAMEAFKTFERIRPEYEAGKVSYEVRGHKREINLVSTSLSGNSIRKISLPSCRSRADLTRFLMLENLPGYFPFTAGVFPFSNPDEDPKRQFAGEGTPTRTNRRFHLLCDHEKAKRLSTAFDSVTLYGEDPHERPDIFGKIGESGVSVCSVEDAKKLYAGFDLVEPNVSVSMTINGPAPMLLAFFFNTAIDQEAEKFTEKNKRPPTEEERKRIAKDTLKKVRGTVQADILKEDQAQNTCIFSTEFALRMMGDIQEYFVKENIKNYYSVSISGYHIAEAGANPISQLAFTLANGLTYVEYYLSRKMEIDSFASNLSFFFSNSLDPEYTVIGRVARRIWALAMKHRYQASDRSQKLKYHIQTSGRSLHMHEITFNDIRTTLQALIAYFDRCNSLHTNAYDEAVTLPTEESVRRAMAIQMIIAKEFGWAKNQNPLQGSFFIDELTDLVEEAVLAEFERISLRGGVLGAMETQYQRSKIQEESLYYETLKHKGEIPIIGVNTFQSPSDSSEGSSPKELIRSTPEEKREQINNLREFLKRNESRSPHALSMLKQTAKAGGNVFEALLEAGRYCSLGQLSHALYEIGGEYRRAM